MGNQRWRSLSNQRSASALSARWKWSAGSLYWATRFINDWGRERCVLTVLLSMLCNCLRIDFELKYLKLTGNHVVGNVDNVCVLCYHWPFELASIHHCIMWVFQSSDLNLSSYSPLQHIWGGWPQTISLYLHLDGLLTFECVRIPVDLIQACRGEEKESEAQIDLCKHQICQCALSQLLGSRGMWCEKIACHLSFV